MQKHGIFIDYYSLKIRAIIKNMYCVYLCKVLFAQIILSIENPSNFNGEKLLTIKKNEYKSRSGKD